MLKVSKEKNIIKLERKKNLIVIKKDKTIKSLPNKEIIYIEGKPGKDGKTPTPEQIIALIEPRIPKVKDGKTPTKNEVKEIVNPLIPTAEEVAEIVLPKIPKPKDGEDGKSFRFADLTAYEKQILTGPQGSNGVGVPRYGTTGQKLAKRSSKDFDTEWVDDIGGIQSIVAGDNITIDDTDPANPIVNSLSDRYKTTSTTSQAIVSTGTLTFTVDIGLAYITQQDVIIAHDATHHMHGTITSYDENTGEFIVDIQHKTGSGTYSSWEINLDGIDAGIPTLQEVTDEGNTTTNQIGIQVTPEAPLHVASDTGVTINNVVTGSISLVTESLPATPTPTGTAIAEPAAGSGGYGSLSNDTGNPNFYADGKTYTARVYPCLSIGGGIYYRSQFYEEISFTDPTDYLNYQDLNFSWGSVSITSETVEYFVEIDVNSGGFSPIGMYSGTSLSIESITGSDPTTPWGTYYTAVSGTAPTPFASGSASYVNDPFGGISQIFGTVYMEVDSVTNIAGTNYCSGNPTSGSFDDSSASGNYDAQMSWADYAGSETNGICRISMDGGSTWYYQYTSTQYSPFTFTSLSNDTDAESRWGQTYTPGPADFDFDIVGRGTSPSGNPVYSVTAPYTVTISDSQNYIIKHSYTGITNAKLLAPSASISYGKNVTTTYYDTGYTAWSDGTARTPTSYGFSGTAQNRDYRAYGFDGTVYSATPLTLSTTSGSGFKYVSGSVTYPSGVTTIKILRQVNGGGYAVSKTLTSPTTAFTDDTTDTTWNGNTTVTPNEIYPPTEILESHGSSLTDEATQVWRSMDGSYARAEFQDNTDTRLGYIESTSTGMKLSGKSGAASIQLGTTITQTATAFSGDITVPDEVYGAGWNGSLEAPTKNAVYDKIQTLGAGTVTSVGTTGLISGGPITSNGTVTTSMTQNKLVGRGATSGTGIMQEITLGTNLTLSGTTLNAAGGSGANPTGTIGLTAVNGSASTFLRSDGAPALSQAIVPTWTGSHTFSNSTYSALFTGGPIGSGTATPRNTNIDIVAPAVSLITGTGTMSNSTSNEVVTITGTGTSFTTQFKVGDLITDSSGNLRSVITRISSNTLMYALGLGIGFTGGAFKIIKRIASTEDSSGNTSWVEANPSLFNENSGAYNFNAHIFGGGFVMFANRDTPQEGVVVKQSAVDGRMKLKHTNSAANLEFQQGGANITATGLTLGSGSIWAMPLRLGAASTGGGETSLYYTRSGTGVGQRITCYTEVYAINGAAPSYEFSANGIDFGRRDGSFWAEGIDAITLSMDATTGKWSIGTFGTTTPTGATTRLDFATVGETFGIKTGTNAAAGTATLSGGTITINTTAITANTMIVLSPGRTSTANIGVHYESARTAGTSFSITSTNASDDSTFDWHFVEKL